MPETIAETEGTPFRDFIKLGFALYFEKDVNSTLKAIGEDTIDAEENAILTDFDVNLRFVKTGTAGGYLKRNSDTAFEVYIDDSFVEAINALIASMAIHIDEDWSTHIEEVLPEGTQGSLERVRDSVRGMLAPGIGAYWQWLNDADASKVYARLLSSMNNLRPCLFNMTKAATFSACSFLILHEICHAYGGHSTYRRKIIEGAEGLDDLDRALNPDQNALEFVADLSAMIPLAFFMLAQHNVFVNLVKFKSAAEPDPLAAFYTAGFSCGFGVAVVFMLVDALFDDSAEDYHPLAVERIVFILGSAVMSCVRKILKEGEGTEESDDGNTMTYKQGLFKGASKALSVWDTLGLKRRHSDAFDQFLAGDFPCLLCNEGAALIIGRLGEVAARLETIKERMTVFNISDRSHARFVTSLGQVRDLYDRLIIATSENQHFKDEILKGLNYKWKGD